MTFVSKKAVSSRINRNLNMRGSALRLCPERSRSFLSLGRYYVIEIVGKGVIDRDIDLESLAIDLGVLKKHEVLSKD